MVPKDHKVTYTPAMFNTVALQVFILKSLIDLLPV